MNFNEETRIKIRKKIDEVIEDNYRKVDDPNHYFKINDKEVLDALLFDIRTDYYGKEYKVFGYNSDNLKYLDLSEVSFENVSFNYNAVDRKGIMRLDKTNARIDFSKSYEYKMNKHLVITNVNLRGIDLSNNNYVNEKGENVFDKCLVNSSDLSFTKLKLNKFTIYTMFYDTKLYGVDLTNLQMSLGNAFSKFYDCDLRCTGLNLVSDKYTKSEDVRKLFENPKYAGCYFVHNGISKFIDNSHYKKTQELKYTDSEQRIDDAIKSINRQAGTDAKVLKKVL